MHQEGQALTTGKHLSPTSSKSDYELRRRLRKTVTNEIAVLKLFQHRESDTEGEISQSTTTSSQSYSTILNTIQPEPAREQISKKLKADLESSRTGKKTLSDTNLQ